MSAEQWRLPCDGVDPEAICAYLERTGWRRFVHGPDGGVYFRADEDILVPFDRPAQDYAIRMRNAVEHLALAEGRHPGDVLRDITTPLTRQLWEDVPYLDIEVHEALIAGPAKAFPGGFAEQCAKRLASCGLSNAARAVSAGDHRALFAAHDSLLESLASFRHPDDVCAIAYVRVLIDALWREELEQ